ncbi:MAG TPA: D-alanine--D-alanine ligase [Gammaproteobacteria bacterium]|nr:D-alanine--D-alanine ligase [Gammaproteobacteria bacterium]
MGGNSAERNISLETGQAILDALIRKKINACAIDATNNFVNELIQGQFDRVFIALHGTQGEDGCVQGVLECLGIPYTGSGVAASALAMDKARTKLVLDGLGLPTPPFGIAYHLSQAERIAQSIGCPLAVKPISEGSTIGGSKVTHLDELPKAFKNARDYGPVLIERWINGIDMFVSILYDQALPSVQVKPASGIYDFKAKYIANDTLYLCPAPLSNQQEEEIRALSKKAFYALGCEGWGRVDLVLDDQGKFWILEVNTIPGMTSHSLVPLSAKVAGINFDDLVLGILATSMKSKTIISETQHTNPATKAK